MKYRNEWKYLCCKADMIKISTNLGGLLNCDSHQENSYYAVHSLYFDNYRNDFAFENDSGVSERYKWRIRYYNNDANTLHIEKKIKRNNLCAKETSVIDINDLLNIFDGDIENLIWKYDNKVIKEFAIDYYSKLIRPKLIIDYERTAFVEPISNIRVTLDKNVAVSRYAQHFLLQDYLSVPLLNKDKNILEIKYDDYLPDYVIKACILKGVIQTSFSKFYLGSVLLKEMN